MNYELTTSANNVILTCINMLLITKQKFLLLLIIVIIGFIIFLFGSPSINDTLKEKNTIIDTVVIKLQIIESITAASNRPDMQRVANKIMDTYLQTVQELCKKQYFYLKTECALFDLNKTNLRKLSTILETGIQEIVEVQNTK